MFSSAFVFARLLLRRLKEGMAETHGACGRCVGKRVSSSPGFKGWRKNFEKLGFKDLELERFKSKVGCGHVMSPSFPDIHHMITEGHNRSNSCHAGSQQRCVCISSADTWILWSFPARVGLVRTFGLEKISPKLYEQLWDCAWWDGSGTDDCSLKKRMERMIVRVMEDEENEEEREEE